MTDLLSVAIPGWLTGLGTLALALATLVLQRRERHDRSLYEKDARERASAARREQASRISAFYGGTSNSRTPASRTALSNRSDEPVYEVVVTLVTIQGAGSRTGEETAHSSELTDNVRVLTVLPPGLWKVHTRPFGRGMSREPGAEIAFTDRAGIHWIRRADGVLDETESSALLHYGIGLPYPRTDLEPFDG